MIQSFDSAETLLALRSPVSPVVCLRPQVIERTAREMVAAFPGDVLYAVKCNAVPEVLEALWAGGVRHFDTASIGEVRAVRGQFPDAVCHFMHPVKSPESIREAYHVHGVRSFVLDHAEELEKILLATGNAGDLTLVVRLAVPGDGALLSLAGKFGASVEGAAALLTACRPHAATLGLTFHVGSQCLAPESYRRAVGLAAQVIAQAGQVDVLDVGGGFPALYRGDEMAFDVFVAAIVGAVREYRIEAYLQCEPGRALVAEGATVLTRVELCRGSQLYLNDGVYGNLSELKAIGAMFPMRVVGRHPLARRRLAAFDLFGPTCDSIDYMPGPHWLPDDIDEGQWIEVAFMGAYSNALRTGFNGFESESLTVVNDAGFAHGPHAGLAFAA